jgi:hypothetical protein
VSLERGPLRFLSTIEELLERESSGSGLEIENTAVGDPPSLPRDTLYPQNLAQFTEKWRSFGRYSSLADSGHGGCLVFLLLPSALRGFAVLSVHSNRFPVSLFQACIFHGGLNIIFSYIYASLLCSSKRRNRP